MKLSMLCPVLLLAGTQVHAEWEPRWTGSWEPDTAFHQLHVLNAAFDADGGVLAGLSFRAELDDYPTLVRFDPPGDGTTWVARGAAAANVTGPMALLADARIATVGQDVDGVTVEVHSRIDGQPIWTRSAAGLELSFDERFVRHSIAQSPDGTVLVAGHADGDFVVARWSADGDALPTWRWCDGKFSPVDDIAALADGGAVLVGRCDMYSGYSTVRFDATGKVAFVDIEPGDIGDPLDPASIAVDGDGNIVVAADPESVHGVPLAEVWKLDIHGERLWDTVLPNPAGGISSLESAAFGLAPDGDAIIAASPPSGDFRVLRLAGGNGAVLWDVDSIVDAHPNVLAVAPGGRVLVAGYAYIDSQGHIGARILELAADGTSCRSDLDLGIHSKPRASAGNAGWLVTGIGTSTLAPEAGDVLVALGYDADGPCDGVDNRDRVFADGFDEPPAPAAAHGGLRTQ
jgi:hypothetical protein